VVSPSVGSELLFGSIFPLVIIVFSPLGCIKNKSYASR
jgi:hypothetical protein